MGTAHRRRQRRQRHPRRDTTETQPEVLGGILVDYVAVAVFDSGQEHTVTAVLRTDGECPQYRTAGLLQHVLADL